jgi:hypothetical protein
MSNRGTAATLPRGRPGDGKKRLRADFRRLARTPARREKILVSGPRTA